jgi:phosphoribosyl-dephospho-CoA transferase
VAADAILTGPPRHALLRVDAAAWAAVLADRPDLAEEPLLADWAPRWPLIARRRAPDDRIAMTPAAIPLPPAHGKRRVALALAPNVIRTIGPPPELSAITPVVPDAWRGTVDAVLALGTSVGSAPRVFGSFAWAAITGLAYIGPDSDLDLLWTVNPGTDVEALLAGLSRIDAVAPGRLDGELNIGAAQMAVNWRELHGRSEEVLVKTTDFVAMHPATLFLQARDG